MPATLVSPSAAPGTTVRAIACRHCGTLFRPAASGMQFCCAGCDFVHQLITRNGLGHYYQLKDAVTAPVGAAAFQPQDFTWLAPLVEAAEQTAGAGPHAELALDLQGLSCVGCVWLVERLWQQHPGALRVELNAQLGRMRLLWRPGGTDVAAFARKLQGFGYMVGPPGAKPEWAESNDLARRVGLSGAFVMNVMLFTLPTYFGMAPDWEFARLFGWISFLTATLSLAVGGGYFLSRAWQGLRVGLLHIDLPIALGLIVGYVASVYGFFIRDEHFIYFDFVAAFAFLMLAGRWTQVYATEKNRLRLLGEQRQPDSLDVIDAATGRPERRGLATLRVGEVFLVPPGRLVPVAARVEDPWAVIGTEWINGEAEPRTLAAGLPVPSGGCNLGQAALRLRATETWADSLLARLTAPAAGDAFRNLLIDKVLRWYMPAVIVLAVGGSAAWFVITGDVHLTLAVGLAVLVISCPCGIGISAPLADEMAVALLRRYGVFVKHGSIWDRLRKLRRIVFDKTGTLTLEHPVLAGREALRALPPVALAALRRLVEDNPHPVSRTLHEESLLAGAASGAGFAVEEMVGLGLRGRDAAGAEWSLGRPGWQGGRGAPPVESGGGHDAELCCDGVPLARFRFTESVRPDAVEEIARLQRRGLEVFILSGDRPEKVQRTARALGLAPEAARASLTPEEKATWIADRDHGDSLMLGDGANDSLAFDRATCRGTPVVHRQLLEQKADFYYLGRGIEGVRRLLEVADLRRRIVRFLFLFSTAYNAASIALALAGLVNPLVAAVIMPVNSLLNLALVTGMFAPRFRAVVRDTFSGVARE